MYLTLNIILNSEWIAMLLLHNILGHSIIHHHLSSSTWHRHLQINQQYSPFSFPFSLFDPLLHLYPIFSSFSSRTSLATFDCSDNGNAQFTINESRFRAWIVSCWRAHGHTGTARSDGNPEHHNLVKESCSRSLCLPLLPPSHFSNLFWKNNAYLRRVSWIVIFKSYPYLLH